MHQNNNFSFNHEVKNEICTNKYSDKEYCEIILIGLKANSTININKNQFSIFITNIYPSIIKFFYQGIKKFFPNKMEIKSTYRNIFGVKVREYKLEIFESNDLYNEIINQEFQSLFCASVAIFLLCGNINSPSSSNYNLYLTLSSEDIVSKYLKLVSHTKNFSFKIYYQKNKTILNIKKCDQISNFLKYIYCFNAVFNYEDVIIQRDHLNNLNRLSNLDIFNQEKAIKANKKHIELINKLYKSEFLLKYFNNDEKQLMKIKLENEFLTLQEISEKYYVIYKKRINKSKVNNLIEKIKKILN